MGVLKKIVSLLGSFLGYKISLPFVILLAVFAGVSWLTISFAQKNPETFGLVKGPSIIKKEEDDLIREVGKLIELPADERPTLATITEENKLKDQAFFAKAKNGDKVLIYTNAKQVFIYRPDEKRVVSVGSVNISQEIQEETGEEIEATPVPAATPKPEETPEPAV